jgi:hypothetical protein
MDLRQALVDANESSKIAITKALAASERREAGLRADLEYIGEITGIAGVDEPMSVTDCVIALKETKEASDEQHDYLSDAGRGFLDGRNFDTLVVDPPEFFNETREDEASDAE